MLAPVRFPGHAPPYDTTRQRDVLGLQLMNQESDDMTQAVPLVYYDDATDQYYYTSSEEGNHVSFDIECYEDMFGTPWDGNAIVRNIVCNTSVDGNAKIRNIVRNIDQYEYGVYEDINQAFQQVNLREDETNIIIPKQEPDHDDNETANVMTGSKLTLRELTEDDELWIGDTGASKHLTKTNKGLVAVRPANNNESFTMGNGQTAKAREVGTLIGTIKGKKVKLTEVSYTPEAKFNLCSITSMMKKGWTMQGDTEAITLTFKSGNATSTIKFDVKVKTASSVLYCARIKLDRENEVAAIQASEDETKNGAWKRVSNINILHQELGHMNHSECRAIARHVGIELNRKPTITCEACAQAKSRRKNLPTRQKTIYNEVFDGEKVKINERISLDLSKIAMPKDLDTNAPQIRNPQWCMMVDQATGRKHSRFYAGKNKMVQPTCEYIQAWKDQGKPVSIIRCDNAGENKLLQQTLKTSKWKLGNIKFEFTAARTPQQNARVEKGFETIYNRGRASMIAANVPLSKRYILAKDCFNTMVKLDGMSIIKYNNNDKCRVEHWGEAIPPIHKHLVQWGWAGVVKTKDSKTAKLEERGQIMMMVGYSDDHTGDCYRMFNERTMKVLTTRDVKWLQRMYYDESGAIDLRGQPSTSDNESDTDNDDDLKLEQATTEVGRHVSFANNNNVIPVAATHHQLSETDTPSDGVESEDDDEQPATKTRSGRIVQPRNQFTYNRLGETGAFTGEELDYYNALSQANTFEPQDPKGNDAGAHIAEQLSEIAGVGAAAGGGFTDTAELKPMKYNEAMQCGDKAAWDEAVEEEYQKFKRYKVFKPVLKEDVPAGAKFVSTTWAMKRKSTGTHRARMTMRGYEQEEGVHYDGSTTAAPVTNDVSIRMMLTLALMAGWIGHIVDVKGAFLHGEFENGEQIYTKIPQGFERHWDPSKYVWLLTKTTYGLIQAAVQFWKSLLEAMKHMKYNRSSADPCLYWNWHEEDGLSVWLSWVDDCCGLGPKKVVMKSKEQLKRLYDCEDIGALTEYVGCKLEWNTDEGSIKFTQPVLLQSYQDEFELPTQSYTTPAEPKTVLTKCDDGQEISDEMQSKYRSAVGKALHMMRWSRPEIWNAVRETSRRMSKANPAHMKAALRLMKYCVDTPNRGWVLKPSRKWDGKDKNFKFRIRGKSDSNYATCKETRRSITGFVVWLEDSLISVKSGMQKIVSLSVTEAEVIALVQCVQELLYMKKIMESLSLQVELPFNVEVDNKGAVDLVNGWSTTGGTKHMDVRIMFLRQLKEQKILKVTWVSTTDNESDIFTKNVDNQTFKRHLPAFVGNLNHEQGGVLESVDHDSDERDENEMNEMRMK